jgi:MoxR-like ATPase
VVELLFISLLARGHILLEDVPGIGKTTLAKSFAQVLGLRFQRVQMTADLLPADLIGVTIYDARTGEFRFRPGPIFTQLLLVDELNRGMPKTQSALLEAMEEGQITVEGQAYPLPQPFLVIATQNPVEHVGTFPLPESQMDRFLLRIHLGYPGPEEEKHLLMDSLYREEREPLEAILSPEFIVAVQEEIKTVRLHEELAEYIRTIATKTREDQDFLMGISPRGALALATASRGRAWLKGRDYVIPEDISALVIPVCSHRIVLRGAEDNTMDRTALQIQALSRILDSTPLPL